MKNTSVDLPGGFSSLVELLRARSRELKDRRSYTFLADGESEGDSLTFGQLDERARAIGALLQESGMQGGRALLLYPPGLDFVTAFFGCLYGGVTAVPAYPPRSKRSLPKLMAIGRDAQPAVALAPADSLPRFQGLAAQIPDLSAIHWMATDDLGAGPAERWQDPGVGPEDLAFLQYTSGSTAAPKGVMVSHGNLLHNQELIRRGFAQSSESVTVGWLPLYHDMGLIGNVLQPLYVGTRCYLMSPLAFLQRPARWLEAISRFRGTTSGGPNFAYELCLRKVDEETRRGLDLSCWRVAFNGAEPVRAGTLERFARAFAGCGFEKSAFLPCYGLAEGTLLVSGAAPAEELVVGTFQAEALEQHRVEPSPPSSGDASGTRRLVACGGPAEGQRLEVVHPESFIPCGPGEVGEIWVSGGSVAGGYWQRREATEEIFQARLADGDGPYLRTGDLGFVDQGRLYITGRLKDLVIIRGRNHYPQDIELTVERCRPGLRPGSGVAFSLDVEGEERLVVVQEVARDAARNLDGPGLVEAIRLAVAEQHEVDPHLVVLARQGAVPKTSSGKVQRRATLKLLLADTLPVLYRSDSRAGTTEESPAESGTAAGESESPMEAYLRREVARSLKVSPEAVAADRPLVLDSLEAIELKNRVQEELGLELPLGDFLAAPTFSELVALAAGLEPAVRSTAIVAGPPTAEYPLSFGQQALWLLQRLSPGSGAYNVSFAARARGEVDSARLERCFQSLARRHGSLRARFLEQDGRVVQRPTDEPMPITHLDAAAWSAERLGRRLAEEAARCFDLTAELPSRLFLYDHGSEGLVVQLVVHHLAVDMWSLVVLAQELGRLYAAGGVGEESLPPVRPAYADFVRRQRELVMGEEGAAQLAHWDKALEGELPDLDLPTDRPRPPVQSFRGGAAPFRLEAAASEGLQALARRRGVTPFVALVALYQTLLQRYSRQDEILVGTPAAGRTRPGSEGLVGYLVNPVVLRARFSSGGTLEDLLAQLKPVVIGALEHQDYPFPLLVEHLQPRRDPARSPIFQAFFALEKPHSAADAGFAGFALGLEGATMEVGPLHLESVPVEQRAAQFDLALMTAEIGGRYAGSLQYNADLFDAATASRLAIHFERLVTAFVEDSAAPLSGSSLLSGAEVDQLRTAWNEATPFPGERPLHELITEVAGRDGQGAKIAVQCAGEALTHSELEQQSNRLAHRLRRLGVRPEVRVGVAVQRSVLLPLATLGVLKAGGAYVPLDPSYPRQRLAFMLEDSGAAVLVTDGEARAALPDLPQTIETIHLDRSEDWQAESDEPIAGGAGPENLAYVLYTSGSTGKPKGVMVPHRRLVNFLVSMADRPGIDGDSVLLAVTPLSFDISGLELYLPLLTGGRLEIATQQECNEGPRLLKRLLSRGPDQSEVTHMQATPATWRLLLSAGWEGSPGLRVLCGGEALEGSLAAELIRRGESLWNLYGPTETTIWSAVHRVVEAPQGTVPIGRAIANTGIEILDENRQPVPPGVAGRLWIGGEGVARGYAGRPALTAERFGPDPFAEQPGARMYDTGDLARRTADGVLEFLGRLDHQVKMRGFRIELGEIEARLAEQPGVRQAVVVARRGVGGDDRLAAYLVAADDERPTPAQLKEAVAERLPDYMVPSLWTFLDALPLTPNGKVDRRALPEPEGERAAAAEYVAPQGEVEGVIAGVWREVLGVEQVGIDDNFFDLGGHSLLLGTLQGRLETALGRPVALVDLFRRPTIRAQAALTTDEGSAVSAKGLERARQRRRAQASTGEIAVIGMAGRFPGAGDVETLWRLLRQGKEGIRTLTEEEILVAGGDPARVAEPTYVRAEGVLDEADLFDADYFGYTPKEAEAIDPQHRVFLEGAVEALANAGYHPSTAGAVGVYAGAGMNAYLLRQVGDAGRDLDPAQLYQLMIGNDKDFLPTRVSYKLNLEGPSVSVQTACSTSLVAVHLACQSLLRGECDMALAGGVSIATPQGVGYQYQPGMILSPDGRCRAFDANARGTVRGGGMGIVVLKRLDEALADGDTVRAVIRGSAINNDGALKVGYTAPSVERQAAVIHEALAVAGVEPESISYIEAHGTGTEMGDPVEIEALTEAFRQGTDRTGFCAVGSVKTNVGHLDAAAGVTGLIKTVLALEHGEIPASLHFERPNPRIPFETSPFRVQSQLGPWFDQGGVRRAGVSSFGIGGTNAHVVVEEAPEAEPGSGSLRAQQLVLLSARSPEALEAMTDSIGEALQEGEPPLADAAFTLGCGRWQHEHRRILVAPDCATAARGLVQRDPEALFEGHAPEPAVAPAFLFPGQGSQYPGMGQGLYDTEPSFRELVDRCCEMLEPTLGLDLRTVLFPRDGGADEAAARLRDTRLAQPALFVVEYALATLWMEWGVKPGAMLGHSIGEYTAACLAGVFSLEDALKVVAERGRLMGEMDPGSMLSISRPWAEVEPLAGEDLSLAAVNAPAACVVSGADSAVDALAARLEAEGIDHRRLHTSHAFHSAMMEPALEPFRRIVSQTTLQPPTLPFLSNVTGTWIRSEEAGDPEYWVRHLRQGVSFADGVGELLQDSRRLLLEVGPGRVLTTLARQHPDFEPRRRVLTSLRHPADATPDTAFLLTSLGRLWLSGVEVDWPAFYRRERRRRIPLPGYAFQRRRYWLERKAPVVTAPRKGKLPPQEWLYLPSWRASATPAVDLPPLEADETSASWLVLADDAGVGAALADQLRAAGRTVVMVEAAPPEDAAADFVCTAPGRRALNPSDPEAWKRLVQESRPQAVVHLWGLSKAPPEAGEEPLFTSLLYLLQALAERAGAADEEGAVEVALVARGLADVSGTEALDASAAAALGLCRVAPQEVPRLSCRAIDVGVSKEALDRQRSAARILAEVTARPAQRTVAFRGPRRWAQSFEAVRGEGSGEWAFQPGGCYLIAGGFGDIGGTFARFLAEDYGAKLVLVSRDPHTDERRAWARELEEAGAEVLAVPADVADEAAMVAAVSQARERFGRLDGVIYAAGFGGLAAARPLARLTPRDLAEQLRTKGRGLENLDRALGDEPLDVCLICSSLSSVLGGLGYAAYTAANLVLDAIVHRRNRRGAGLWTGINWDGWGFAKEGKLFELAMTPEEGVEALRHLLALGPQEQVVVSTAALEPRLRQWVNRPDAAESASPESAAGNGEGDAPRVHGRRDLQNAYVAPTNEVEQRIAQIWQQQLGMDRVGIHDNFFELGGTSLLGVQVIAELNRAFGVEIPTVSLYEGSTVKALAEVLAELQGESSAAEEKLDRSHDRGSRRRERVRKRRARRAAGGDG